MYRKMTLLIYRTSKMLLAVRLALIDMALLTTVIKRYSYGIRIGKEHPVDTCGKDSPFYTSCIS